VAGNGRHLYLQVVCPAPFEHYSGRVEFTESRLRSDYRLPVDPAVRNQVAKLNRPHVLRPPPFVTDMKDRLEAEFELTPDQARCLHRDRLFTARYELLGANSNAAMRRVAGECGCPLPAGMERLGGLFGEFPGIGADPGDEVPPERWGAHGLASGPQALPQKGSRGATGASGAVRTLPAP
jgi:hypothetical protein